MLFNVYCDESCHLEHDHIDVMGMGAIWVPKDKVREINNRLKEIKQKYKARGELKWSRIQPSKNELYKEIVNYFFDNDDLHFRIIIIDKKELKHKQYLQTHDEFYNKMYFRLVFGLFKPDDVYRVYMDIKDTHSRERAEILNRCLTSSVHDYPKNILKDIFTIRSHEIQIMQVTDILLGAVTCECRNIRVNTAKQEIIGLIKKRARYSLRRTTLLQESKFNILHFPNGNI